MLWSNLEEVGTFFEPWEEFERMRRAFLRASAPSNGEFPAVNVWSSADGVLVTTELPGVEPGGIDISVSGNTLTVNGEREPEALKEGESYHRRERWHGKFSKTIDLPFNVQADKVQAKFAKGILSIDLPRAEAEKPKKIEIASN